ncbi:hypothetical protein L1987_31694 [Smallanthus sonchifolius]|uniref:Uncharacterized protein n=1 Tax=Smallanthus sonchifolius TaxID=185202 RepID=A0ACB9I7H5_9ASTR|nr:hypothetical protein L1987_31694 [Smallanthus sonchifolius]
MRSSWNSYWFVDHAIHDHSRPRIRAMLQAAAKKSLIACRIWAFNDGDYNALQISPCQFDERIFKNLNFGMNLFDSRGKMVRSVVCMLDLVVVFWNSYWFVDHAIHDHSRPRIRAMLQAAAKKSLIACRIWAFNDGDYNALQISPCQFDERIFKEMVFGCDSGVGNYDNLITSCLSSTNVL